MLPTSTAMRSTGEGQARTDRTAWGQDGSGAVVVAGGPPLSANGLRLRYCIVVLRRVISEPEVAQQKLNAQLTSAWCRRIAMSERTWKSAQPRSSLTCL